MRGLFWLLVMAGIVVGPFLVWKLDVIDLTATATEETVATVKDKTQEVRATRVVRGAIKDRVEDAGVGIQAETPRAEIELRIYAGINAQRRNGGRATLDWDPDLASLARAHSEDMRNRDYYNHFSPEGLGPIDRLHKEGMSCRKRTHVGISENLHIELDKSGVLSVSTNQVASDAVVAWVESPGHNRNLMDGKFSSTGVGAALGTWKGEESVFLTQVFC